MRVNHVVTLGFLAASCLLANTADAGVIKKSQKVAIQSGQMGAIIPSITPSGKNCSFGEIAFRNLQTRKLKENSLTQKASYLRLALGSFRCHQVITARLCRMRMENEYFRATAGFPRA